MRTGVGQDVLDHTFGGVTCGLVLLEDDKHFQSSVYISSCFTIHINRSHTPHSIGEWNKVEEQSASDLHQVPNCQHSKYAGGHFGENYSMRNGIPQEAGLASSGLTKAQKSKPMNSLYFLNLVLYQRLPEIPYLAAITLTVFRYF